MTGYVYFITNPSLREGLYKIGMTDNLEERINCFNRETSCPLPWRVLATVQTEKYKELERHLHHIYSAQRVNPKKEFFEFGGDDAVDDVLAMLEECSNLLGGIYTANEIMTSQDADKKARFSFKLINIPAGAKVTFKSPDCEDSPIDFWVAANQRNIVENENDINDKDKWKTISSTVQELLHRPGLWSACTECWYYNDKSCAQIRKELNV